MTINHDVFYENTNMLDDVVLPNLTGSLGGGAFAKTNIKRVLDLGNITETDTSLVYYPTSQGAGPFSGCVELELLVLPSSLTSIGSALAAGCTSLKAILVKATTPPTLKNDCFSNTNNCPIYVPDDSVEAYKNTTNWINYASRIKSIYEYEGVIQFKDTNVRSLCLANFDMDGDGIITIEEAASVTDIGTIFAYSKITSFNEFEFFTGVTSITTNAFRNSTIKSIELPSSITSIEWGAFFQCTSLSSVKVYSINPPTLDAMAFDSNASDRIIYVPDKSLDTYKAASGWSSYALSIKPLSEYV